MCGWHQHTQFNFKGYLDLTKGDIIYLHCIYNFALIGGFTLVILMELYA